MSEKWVRIKLWQTAPYSGKQTIWIVFHKNNPLSINKDESKEWQPLIRWFDKMWNYFETTAQQ